MSKRSLSCITTTETVDRMKKRKLAALNILIVDDNPINLTILKRHLTIILKKSLSRLEEASNGVEALELLKLYSFDLVLLDIDMPVLNGIDTTKKIRESSSIPIIAVTTNDSIKSKEIYFDVGMNDCISKPVKTKLLKETIYKTLSIPMIT